jgi:iron complex outermembrane receptor protein
MAATAAVAAGGATGRAVKSGENSPHSKTSPPPFMRCRLPVRELPKFLRILTRRRKLPAARGWFALAGIMPFLKTPRPHRCPSRLLMAAVVLCALVGTALAQRQPAPDAAAADAGADEIVELSPFEVNATKDDGYIAANSLSGTGYNMALMDLPRPIDVLTSEFIEDMGVWDVADALRYGGSLSDNGNGSPTDEMGFYTRGFSSGIQLRNGYRTYVPSDPAFVDRLEVLKGPSSTFAGAAGPGGAISVVARRPAGKQTNQAGFRYGSYGSYRVEASSGGVLGASRKLRYFAGLAAQRIGSQLDFAEGLRRVAGATFTYNFTPRSQLTLDLQWVNSTGIQGIPPVYINNPREQGWVTDIRRGFNKAGPDATSDKTQRQALVEFTQALGRHWYFRAAASAGDSRSEDITMSNANRVLVAGTRETTRTPLYTKAASTSWFAHASLLAKYDFWKINYTGLAGVDYYRTPEATTERWGLPAGSGMSNINIDSTNRADYAIPAVAKFTALDTATIKSNTEKELMLSNVFGLFKSRLFLFQAYRFAQSEYESADPARANLNGTGSARAGAGSYGVSFRVFPWLGAFASNAETYQPNFDADYDGNRFGPTTGRGWDYGLKFSALQNRLSGSVTGFTTRRTGFLHQDPGHTTYRMQAGTDESKGAEFTIAGKIARWWNLTGNYTYTDNRITAETAHPHWLGKPQANVPRHAGNIWSMFTLARGLKLGLGVRHMGTRRGLTEQSSANPEYDFYRSPSCTAVEASVQYTKKIAKRTLTAALKINNLLNHDYKVSWSNYAAPINYTVSIKLVF